jgi:1,2-phenylacetyl-CoA epoxidase catalytic subunit
MTLMTTISEAEIKEGGRQLDYDDFEHAPQEYRDLVVQLLLVQADGEIGVRDLGYFELVGKFPTPADQWMATRIATEEIGHFRYANHVLNGVGFDAEHRVFAPRQERYLPLFRYEMDDWIEFVTFKGVVESMGRLLLEGMFNNNFVPWRETVRRIWQEEKGHIGFGISRLRRVCETEEGRAKAQGALDIWYPRVGAFAGKSRFTDACMEWGLKDMANDEMRRQFEEETTPWIEELGLRAPSLDGGHAPKDAS